MRRRPSRLEVSGASLKRGRCSVAQSRSTDPLRSVSDVRRRIDVAVDLDSRNARISRMRTDRSFGTVRPHSQQSYALMIRGSSHRPLQPCRAASRSSGPAKPQSGLRSLRSVDANGSFDGWRACGAAAADTPRLFFDGAILSSRAYAEDTDDASAAARLMANSQRWCRYLTRPHEAVLTRC
jgi:hypothetical protein